MAESGAQAQVAASGPGMRRCGKTYLARVRRERDDEVEEF